MTVNGRGESERMQATGNPLGTPDDSRRNQGRRAARDEQEEACARRQLPMLGRPASAMAISSSGYS